MNNCGMHFDTLAEARREAKFIGGTYRKVEGGWLVMTWHNYYIWRNQK